MIKVYFAAAVSGGRDFEKYFPEIVAVLENLGMKILSEHVVDFKKQQEFRMLAENAKDFYKYISVHNKKLMHRADLFVAECSQGSLGTGFEICYAAYVLKVPVVCLRHKKAKGKASSTIYGDNSKLIRPYYYSDRDIQSVLEKAVKEVI